MSSSVPKMEARKLAILKRASLRGERERERERASVGELCRAGDGSRVLQWARAEDLGEVRLAPQAGGWVTCVADLSGWNIYQVLWLRSCCYVI